jgi:hypothetical protein
VESDLVRIFADASVRKSWIEDKGMIVFSLWSPAMPGTEDVLVAEPFDFDATFARAIRAPVEATTIGHCIG